MARSAPKAKGELLLLSCGPTEGQAYHTKQEAQAAVRAVTGAFRCLLPTEPKKWSPFAAVGRWFSLHQPTEYQRETAKGLKT